jgi:hypothetical protein
MKKAMRELRYHSAAHRSEIHHKMQHHFEDLRNLREVMRSHEWSCYLYDTFEVDARDEWEDHFYKYMARVIEERWFYISEGDRISMLRKESEIDREQMIDNVCQFERRCFAISRLARILSHEKEQSNVAAQTEL